MAVCMVSSPESLVGTIQAIPQAQKPSTKQYLSYRLFPGHQGLILRCSCVLGTDDIIVHSLGAVLYSENPLFNKGNNVKVYQKQVR